LQRNGEQGLDETTQSILVLVGAPSASPNIQRRHENIKGPDEKKQVERREGSSGREKDRKGVGALAGEKDSSDFVGGGGARGVG